MKHSESRYMVDFGLSVEAKQIGVTGRVLAVPEMEYSNTTRVSTCLFYRERWVLLTALTYMVDPQGRFMERDWRTGHRCKIDHRCCRDRLRTRKTIIAGDGRRFSDKPAQCLCEARNVV